MKTLIRCASAAALLLGSATLVGAQVVQPRDPNMPDPKTTIPEKVDPPITGTTRPNETLSDRLERTDGVIRPPATGAPDMTVPAPAPDPGTTPVIRPNPNIEAR